MTPYEVELALELAQCSMLPGSSQKRFARDLAFRAKTQPEAPITLRQRHYLEILAWRYRKQLPERYRPDRKPFNLPRPVKETKKRDRRRKSQIVEAQSQQGKLL
jgi:hypothetical protein